MQVVDSPAVADLLLTLAASASCDAGHRNSLFVGAPSDFVSSFGIRRSMPASETIAPAVLAQCLPGASAAQPAALLAWQKATNGLVRLPASVFVQPWPHACACQRSQLL